MWYLCRVATRDPDVPNKPQATRRGPIRVDSSLVWPNAGAGLPSPHALLEAEITANLVS